MIQFGIATWVSFVLTNVSFAAMGMELRRRGVLIEWLSYSFNVTVRLAKVAEVTRTYWAFKRSHDEFPWYACAMLLFASGIFVIPAAGLLRFLLSRS